MGALDVDAPVVSLDGFEFYLSKGTIEGDNLAELYAEVLMKAWAGKCDLLSLFTLRMPSLLT